MSETAEASTVHFGRWSMVLFILGVLGPFVLYALLMVANAITNQAMDQGDAALMAVGFGVLAQLLAFVLGIVGCGTTAGRVGLVGSATLLAFVVFVLGIVVYGTTAGRVGLVGSATLLAFVVFAAVFWWRAG